MAVSVCACESFKPIAQLLAVSPTIEVTLSLLKYTFYRNPSLLYDNPEALRFLGAHKEITSQIVDQLRDVPRGSFGSAVFDRVKLLFNRLKNADPLFADYYDIQGRSAQFKMASDRAEFLNAGPITQRCLQIVNPFRPL